MAGQKERGKKSTLWHHPFGGAGPQKGKEVSPASEFWWQDHLGMACNKKEEKKIFPFSLSWFPFLLLKPELKGFFLICLCLNHGLTLHVGQQCVQPNRHQRENQRLFCVTPNSSVPFWLAGSQMLLMQFVEVSQLHSVRGKGWHVLTFTGNGRPYLFQLILFNNSE